MAKDPPVVYLLHGEDEFAIARFVANLKAKLTDSPAAEMNITMLDGRTTNLDELVTATSVIPFLARRRLVVLYYPLALIHILASREKILDYLNRVPATTALILVEHRTLSDGKARVKGKLHWLETWALGEGNRVFLRRFDLPKGAAMANWIQDRARELGGEFTYQAAGLLASQVGEEPRLADQEIRKLLIYVNYQRSVEPGDVENLAAYVGEGNIFAMVDALGNQDAREASRMLHRLLVENDPLLIFGMVVRQFRLLLLAKEILEDGGNEKKVMVNLDIHPYVAKKITAQARSFSLKILEKVYHRLLDIDEAFKNGEVEVGLGMDLLIADSLLNPGITS